MRSLFCLRYILTFCTFWYIINNCSSSLREEEGSIMTVRQYFILAEDRPYKPLTGGVITYSVELDTSHRRDQSSSSPVDPTPALTKITLRITHKEDSWGPDTIRIEGFWRNPKNNRAYSVRGHHKGTPAAGSHQIGVLQVSEDD